MSSDGLRWHLRRVFRLPLTRARVRNAVNDELRFHLEGRIEELMATGLARDEAESEARRRFGDYESYRGAATAIDEQIVHERHRSDVFDAIAREARGRAMRGLRGVPALACAPRMRGDARAVPCCITSSIVVVRRTDTSAPTSRFGTL